jgi:L-ascorbate metabolism protein UlaG (beta-lactamase superfamily)
VRLKRGRPDIARYANRFDVPAAGSGFAVTFLGVSSLLFRAGTDALLTDGFCSRPPLLRVGFRKIGPDPQRIDGVLTRAGIDRLAAVMPVHTHFDHALDSTAVALRTGAMLVGGESAAQLGRGGGLPSDRIAVVTSGQQLTFGSFALTFITSAHCPPDRYPGTITAPVVPPARVDAWRCGDAWSILVEHESGRSALVQGSAGYVPGSLAGRRAEVAYLGVGQLGLQDDDYVNAYWEHTVRTVGARRAVLIHWDDFFRPLDQPLLAIPSAADDLDATMRRLDALAQRDGVTLHLPTVFRREDPWRGLGDVTA